MNRIVFALLEILAAVVFLLPVYWLRFRDPGKIAASCVFSFYLVAVWSLVGLPTILYARFDINLNLIPFAGMIADAKNCLLNVALFVPLGFLLPMFWEKYHMGRKTVLFGLGMSLVIELTQIFTLRATDVNDLITNVAGTALGWAMWAGLQRNAACFRRLEKSLRVGELPFLCGAVVAVMFIPQPFLAAALWEIFA